MPRSNTAWDQEFTALFERCVGKFRQGNEDFTTYYTPADSAFLESIGYQPREFFDFVEDFCNYGEPVLSTAVLIAAARRDYLLTIQKGEKSTAVLQPATLPAKDDSSLGGIRWLKRIIPKAVAKLRGELHPDIMYGCGGDRAFFALHNVHGADFLRAVWAYDGDEQKVLDWLKGNR